MAKEARQYDDVCYNKNFLDKVVVRIDFSSEVKAFSTPPEELVAKFLEHFPIPEPINQLKAKIEINGDDPHPKFSQSVKNVTWVYHAKDRTSAIELSKTHFVLTLFKYDTYEGLRGLFQKMLRALLEVDNDFEARRIGMRYINLFNINDGESPTDYSKYFNNNMLCMLNIPGEREAIARAFNSLVLNYGDVNLLMQYGIYNPDFPATVRKKEFILDIDAYYQGPVDLADVEGEIDRFHDRIQVLFEQCLTDEMREEMS